MAEWAAVVYIWKINANNVVVIVVIVIVVVVVVVVSIKYLTSGWISQSYIPVTILIAIIHS